MSEEAIGRVGPQRHGKEITLLIFGVAQTEMLTVLLNEGLNVCTINKV